MKFIYSEDFNKHKQLVRRIIIKPETSIEVNLLSRFNSNNGVKLILPETEPNLDWLMVEALCRTDYDSNSSPEEFKNLRVDDCNKCGPFYTFPDIREG